MVVETMPINGVVRTGKYEVQKAYFHQSPLVVVLGMGTNHSLSPILEPIKMYLEESEGESKGIFITSCVGVKNMA